MQRLAGGTGKKRKQEMATHLCKLRMTAPTFQSQPSYSSLLIGIHSSILFHKRAKTSVDCIPSGSYREAGPELWLLVGTHVLPHPKKVEKGGEDAFLVSNYKGGVIAVADGVSGWAEQDVDPALFSQELMANASALVGDEEVDYDPRNLIKKAHAAMSSVGSATVIVAMLERNGILKIGSVGDCGLRIVRKGQIIFTTSPQEHYFDCPYQLSSEAIGQTYLDAMTESTVFYLACTGDSFSLEAFNLSIASHSHEQEKQSGEIPIQVTSVELMKGDTIVMGSDGLFDNVFDVEITSAVTSCSDVTDAAKELANVAHIHSLDPNFDSPYSMEARARGFDVPWWKKALGMNLTGGKLDDITVVVGRVESS